MTTQHHMSNVQSEIREYQTGIKIEKTFVGYGL